MVFMAGAIGISLINPLIIEEALDHYIAMRDFDGLVRLGFLRWRSTLSMSCL